MGLPARCDARLLPAREANRQCDRQQSPDRARQPISGTRPALIEAGWKKPSRWSKDWERFKAGWKKSSRVVQGLGAVQSNARLQLPLDKTSGQRHRGIWFLSLTERPFHPNVTGAARHRCLSGGDLAPRQARMRRCIRRSSQSVQQEQFQQLCRRGLIRKPVRQRLRATPRWRLDRPALRRSRHQRGPFGSVLNI